MRRAPCQVQIRLIDLLCSRGANPARAVEPAACLRECEAAQALLDRGAPATLAVAAALGREEEFAQLLPQTGGDGRHRALALASQFGRAKMVATLLDHGEDPSRYNPVGTHSHSTPLHQAALGGHADVVRLLLEHGADPRRRDLLWRGTAADWARHAGHSELESLLRSSEAR
jgi:ankyrin repeat protein